MGDLVTILIGYTHDPVYVENLDLLSFNALCDSVTRLKAMQNIDAAWNLWVAHNCDKKGLEKWVKQWERETEIKPKNDGTRFQKDLGSKIRKK